MKKKFLSAVYVIILIIPWTILPLRLFRWALLSPTAEIMISCYAAFMIIGGIFTRITYIKTHERNNLMKACLVVNSLYAVFGIGILGLMSYSLLPF